MMKTLLCILLLVFCRPPTAWAQQKQYSIINGCLIDKGSRLPLGNANIKLIQEKDSLPVSTAQTDKKGTFLLYAQAGQSYQLIITYLGYRSIQRSVTAPGPGAPSGIDTIIMERTGLTLEEVEIMVQRAPFTLRKDTLEFNAGAFNTRENSAMVELLRKLPGVQIEKDGSIKVSGEVIRKILVDGRPFFGDDPKIAAKNLPADIIDKVQVIDRKPEHLSPAPNSNNTEKVINITIKKNRKNELFGKANAGYGTDDRYTLGGDLNHFGDTQQVSVFANSNNLNGNLEESGRFQPSSGGGITRTINAGINYNRDISKHLKLSGSYTITNNHTVNSQQSSRQNFLPDSTFYYNQANTADNKTTMQVLETKLHWKIDSLHNLSFLTYLRHIKQHGFLDNHFESIGSHQQMLNNGITQQTTRTTTPNYSAAIVSEKKFKKAGRSLNSVLGIGWDNNDQSMINKSNNAFILPDGRLQEDTLDQLSQSASPNINLSFSTFFVNPIGENRFLEVSYFYNLVSNQSDKTTFDYNFSKNVYDRKNDSLSNSFESDFSVHRSTIGIRTQRKKFDYSLGITAQWYYLNNTNISDNSRINQHSFHLFPSLVFNYNFSNHEQLRFSYSGSVQQPSAQQLQPVPDNSNPLYVRRGNPDLKASVLHIGHLTYQHFSTTSARSLNANMQFFVYRNKVVNTSYFDSLGRQITEPANENGAYNINAHISSSLPLPRLQTSINLSSNISLNRDINYVNGVRNPSKNFGIEQELSFNHRVKALLDISAVVNVRYNNLRYAVLKGNNADYLNYNLSLHSIIDLPGGFAAGASLTYQLNTGRAAGYNLDATMLHGFISKTVFRNNQGVIRLQAIDLLRENTSISRNVTDNYIEDVQSAVLQRFILLSFSYFLKTRKARAGKGSINDNR